ncbi:GNAT family N-acetyltransferase [Saccharibacillus brassicae]|uniref:GNAT family N-acetyltransferase n=1 Tax=Saccharibacillus brassicae TaxID=2583377 RepID=A0A4Y6UYV1_SACBS|nr:GNAT family N-acetyltransferase [Saccharibacillus brassicae]QDH21407.1 GNAT family N-acetyltransferase [Saccharibacillus brassicae]
MNEYETNADQVEIMQALPEHFPQLAQLWLDTSLAAHAFIDSAHWTTNKQAMEERYLPESDVQMCLENGEIVGFAAVKENRLAALFIDESRQGRGYGRRLLDRVKEGRDTVTLNVYAQNAQAGEFYRKQGFKLEREQVDAATNEREYAMVWNRD